MAKLVCHSMFNMPIKILFVFHFIILYIFMQELILMNHDDIRQLWYMLLDIDTHLTKSFQLPQIFCQRLYEDEDVRRLF
jgi:hypothetical protein